MPKVFAIPRPGRHYLDLRSAYSRLRRFLRFPVPPGSERNFPAFAGDLQTRASPLLGLRAIWDNLIQPYEPRSLPDLSALLAGTSDAVERTHVLIVRIFRDAADQYIASANDNSQVFKTTCRVVLEVLGRLERREDLRLSESDRCYLEPLGGLEVFAESGFNLRASHNDFVRALDAFTTTLPPHPDPQPSSLLEWDCALPGAFETSITGEFRWIYTPDCLSELGDPNDRIQMELIKPLVKRVIPSLGSDDEFHESAQPASTGDGAFVNDPAEYDLPPHAEPRTCQRAEESVKSNEASK